ncbi:hypothetical protein EXS45_02150 [Candidatus Nomurabacteria bacterium]|nr:hypothetical protein [Candidatus Nomurabacteria bacterium]
MESQITNKDTLETFDGELLHPSLDVKDGILALGFRYRSKPQETKEIFIVVCESNIQFVDGEAFNIKDKHYFFEKRNRKLAILEEKWSASALKQFLEDYGKLKNFGSSGQAVFQIVLDLTKKYIQLDKDIDYYLLSAWIIGTYFFPIFYAYPFLHIKAPKRSGKSQCLNLLTQVCFNAIKARPSLPALGDTVDSLRGTYLIDQADSLERKGNEELLDVLADSYKKSGGKRRIMNMDKKKGREILEIETYCPKAFASIRELPEDLRDRCLAVPLIRSQKNFPDPDENNENWREIRGKIYTFLMTNYDLVATHYSVKKISYRSNQEILGRSLELWLPFETMLECCGMQEKIIDARKNFLSQYEFSEYEPSELEEEVMKAILSKLGEQPEIVLNPKEIAESIGAEIFLAVDTPKQKSSKVGWAIKKFNLASEKMPRSKEGVRYLFQKAKVDSIFKSYCKTEEKHTPLTLEPINTVNPEQIT